MTSIGSGSGQPHLLALLRAMRLRSEPPDDPQTQPPDANDASTGRADAADPDELSAQGPRAPGATSMRPVLPSSLRGAAVHTPAGTAVVVSPGSGIVTPPAAQPPVLTGPPTTPALPAGPSQPGQALPGQVVAPAPAPGAALPVPAEPPAPVVVAPPGRPVPGAPVPGAPVAGAPVAGAPVPVTPTPVLPLPATTVPGTTPAPQPPAPQPPAPQPPARQPSTTAPAAPAPGTVPSGSAPGNGPVGPVVPPSGRPIPGAHPTPGAPLLPGAPTSPSWPGSMPPIGGVAPLHPSPPAAPGAPVDGPNPADDVALHDQHRLLSTSISLAGEVDAVAARLHDALLLGQPRLVAALPGTEAVQREQLAQALTWLVDNLEHPPVLAAGCGQLGAALREFGILPPQLQLIGAALAEAMRAGMANGWRQEYDTAWRSTWQHLHQWIAHGAAEAAYHPMSWTAVVTDHDQRRPDLAVLRLRPYLPIPFQPGQYARVEVAELPGVRRPYSLAGAPRLDNVLELHVRAKSDIGVSGALVHRTRPGDKVRLSGVAGQMGLPPAPGRDLLLIAGDTGVAPMKALLTELAILDDPRAAVLFWGVRTLDDLYDIDEVAAIARVCQRATVIPVVSEGEPGAYASGLVTDAVTAYGEWSQHEVYLAGPPPMLAATRAVLGALGLTDDRIHHDPTEVDPSPV